MYPYIISFIILIVIAAIVFRITQRIVDKMGPIGDNIWFLIALASILIIIISIHSPSFWEKHMSGNGLGSEMELDAIAG